MTLNDAFSEVKARLDAPTVAAHYGLIANPRGYCHCPAHVDKTPSLRLYPGDRGFYCYSCHAGGSVIDLAQLILKIDDPLQTLKVLDHDFALNLHLNQPMTVAEQQRAAKLAAERQHRQEIAEMVNNWRWSTADRIAVKLRSIDEITATREPTATEAKQLRRYDRYEWAFRQLLSDDMAAIVDLYLNRAEVEKEL